MSPLTWTAFFALLVMVMASTAVMLPVERSRVFSLSVSIQIVFADRSPAVPLARFILSSPLAETTSGVETRIVSSKTMFPTVVTSALKMLLLSVIVFAETVSWKTVSVEMSPSVSSTLPRAVTLSV